MRLQLYRWQLKLNRKTLQERVVIFSIGIVIIAILWNLFLWSQTQLKFQHVDLELDNLDKQINYLVNQKQQIETAAADPKNKQMIERYQQLNQQLNGLNTKIKTYKFSVVSPQQLAAMLQSVLKEVNDVKIISFKVLPSGH